MVRARVFVLLFLAAAVSAQAAVLYLGDYSAGNGSVNYFNSATGTFLLQTTAPNMGIPGQMANGGASGNLYVADGQGTVDVFNPTTGAYLTQFGSFVDASGLAFSPAGNLYVSDLNGGSSVVDEYSASGTFVKQIISASAGLDYSGALAFGPNGNLYIADSSGNIYEYNLSTTALTQFAYERGPALNLVFGLNGNLYVTNGNEVDVFNGTTGTLIGTLGNTASALGANALGMAFGADGNLYVADSNGIDVVSGTTGNVTGNFIAVGGDVVNPQFLAFQTPEPSAFLLGAAGLIAIAFLRIRKRARNLP
jgi:outer membrane protein assembly factor BamB